MRDITTRNLPKDTIFKDVVVIGNGPSGISLSYMLSGHWPYWIKSKIPKHPDELLRARLNYADNKKSLVLQDLMTLADGLEGRSTNPVSLLLDSLQHPCADLGMELPSMLEYKFHPEKQIDHVVIGKGLPGGSWHRMDPNLRTLSLSAWMSLPGLDFNKWELIYPEKNTTIIDEKTKRINSLDVIKNLNDTGGTELTINNNNKCKKCSEMEQNFLQCLHNNNSNCNNNNETEVGALCCKCSKQQQKHLITTTTTIKNKNTEIKKDEIRKRVINNIDDEIKLIPQRRNLSLKRQNSKEVQTRALISRVAEYYENYVTVMGLEKYFMNNAIVTTVLPLNQLHQGKECNGRFKDARWIVCGFCKLTGISFCYASKNVVLANGSSDLANRLGLKGEGLATPWLKHELPQLECALEVLTEKQRANLKPVLIVGAGLSAADAVTICRQSRINVIHVYRNRTAGLDKMLPENVYPEYHEVHKMMKDSSNNYDYYTPLPEHTITDISHIPTERGGHVVTVQHLKTGETKHLEISYCTILIGSRPDFRFLPNLLNITKNQITDEITQINKCDENLFDCAESQSQIKWNKKMSWLKTICAKCKHINLCDRSGNKRTDYKRICGHNNNNINNNINNNNNSNNINNNLNNKINQLKNCNENNERTKIEALSSGIGLGEDIHKSVDCKTNPISVDKYTNKVLNSPQGLYAMGPLISDNFVRFIPGGALSITSSLHKEND